MALAIFIIGWLEALLILGLIARFLAALFSRRSRQQIKAHPKWHFGWFLIIIILIGVQNEMLQITHERRLKSQLAEVRKKVHEFVEQGGGWNALRSETRMLAKKTDSQNPFNWFFEKQQNPELTNSFPLISKLNPWEIYFQKNATNGDYVFMEVYFNQWGGGRDCTRYYGLALTPTNNDESPSSLVRPGDKILKLTNSVYEVTWHF
jgi:hypothetical protein